jgi:hypothetical protein
VTELDLAVLKELESLVEIAEQRYGAREAGWKIAFGGFRSDRPHTVIFAEQRLVLVLLTENAKDDWQRTRFQLAHEAVHCLVPRPGRLAANIEEGIATLFSLTCSELPPDYVSACIGTLSPYYRAVAEDVAALVGIYPDAIRRLRAKAPCFDDMTPQLLVDTLGASPELATRLCARRPAESLQ